MVFGRASVSDAGGLPLLLLLLLLKHGHSSSEVVCRFEHSLKSQWSSRAEMVRRFEGGLRPSGIALRIPPRRACIGCRPGLADETCVGRCGPCLASIGRSALYEPYNAGLIIVHGSV
jgi:hypothetical protein